MSSDTTQMLPGWKRACEAVWSLMPITREHITQARSCIAPSSILYCAELAQIPFHLSLIPRWEEHDWGPGLYTKEQLFNRVFDGVPTFNGELILITDDCFPITRREPFFGRGETLREFLAEAPFVFDGDVVFIWPEACHISVFDHEGHFAHIDCRVTRD